MKRKIYFLLSSLTMVALLTVFNPVMAQEPPHPPAAGHGAQGNQPPGGGAPIDGGLAILVALAVGYGIRKSVKTNTPEE